MKNIIRSRLSIISAGLILASSAAILLPSVNAQAPAPSAGADSREFDAASALMDQKKTKQAMEAFEKFLTKYKMLSPRSLDAKFKLAICYILEGDYESPVRHLKEIIDNPKIEAPGREVAQLLIAKAITLKGVKMPTDSPAQKESQNKIFERAIGEYEKFLIAFPKSRDFDNAHFLRATLMLQIGKYDESLQGYQAVENIGAQNTPLYWDAVLSGGRVLFARASKLMEMKDGKEAKADDIKAALKIFEQAQPILVKVFQGSNDIAMSNEATFYAAQMQLTRSQNVSEPDEAKKKQIQQEFLQGAYEAFRAVRSREEVLKYQEGKIEYYKRQIPLVAPGLDYQSRVGRINNLIDIEDDKLERYKSGQDQYLASKLALARIYLFQKKPDESRTLLRYLAGQTELLKGDKDAPPQVASMLALTYAEQNNLEKTSAGYEEFRTKFKGDANGDNLPLVVAKLLIDSEKKENMEKAIAVVDEGMTDYKNWRFVGDSNSILAAALTKLGRFEEAQGALRKAIEALDKKKLEDPGSANDEVAASLQFTSATIADAMAREKVDPALADKAIEAYNTFIQKYPSAPLKEDAEFAIAQIQSGKDSKAAIPLLQKFVDSYSGGSGKSSTTAKNLTVAHYLLGKCLDATGQKDAAITAWAQLAEKYPDSEPSPGTYFQRFNIYNERKDYPKCAELMDQFVKAYPQHENVYFAFNNQAEIMFAQPGPAGKSPNMVENTRSGSKKLMEFVDYELQKDLKQKRGDQALVKIAVKWIAVIPRKNFTVMSNEDKLVWQEAVDNATKAVEVILDKYSDQPAEVNRVGEGLEKLVEVQKARTAADPGNAAKVASYFKDLAGKYDSKPSVRCNVLFALGAVIWDKNRSEAMRAMNDGYKADVKFTSDDLDRYMDGLLADKKFDKVGEIAAKLAADYPQEMQDAQATALFWQGKVLEAQSKIKEAGDIFNELKTKFPKSSKVLEADYGIIRAKVDEGKLENDFIPRLQEVFKIQHKTFELPARALLLVARVQEMEKDYDGAIDNYIKIHVRYESVPDISAEGLWRGANLLEKQAKKELPVMLGEERKKFMDEIKAKRPAKETPVKEEPAKETPPKDGAAPATAATTPASQNK